MEFINCLSAYGVIMKKLIFTLCFSLNFLLPAAYAGGGMTHMYIAGLATSHLDSPKLRQLLHDYQDAYMVGAYYPDSGYINGAKYGEDSHWDEFVYAFSDYLKETYPYPIEQNPKLVAFLFGVASHRVSDPIIHRLFYPESSKHDFNNDTKKADDYGDVGIDLLLNIDKNQWLKSPSTWWVPVKDLVAIYKRMGKSYPAHEIIKANAILKFAGYGERLISVPAYPYLKWRMPWTAAHYIDSPIGGIQIDAQKVAAYQNKLWLRLLNQNKSNATIQSAAYHHNIAKQPLYQFAKKTIFNNTVSIPLKNNQDGSIELYDPVINNAAKLQSLTQTLLKEVTSFK